jgi:hypothetical protein
MTYKILRVTGDYRARQVAANNAGAALYLEAHYNSAPRPNNNAPFAQGTEVLVTDTSGALTRTMARQMAGNIAQAFALTLRASSGVKVLTSASRGYGNLAHALLIEPWFIDAPEWANRAITEADRLAQCLASVIRQHVPDGSTIALSLGHRGKTSDPHDRGAKGGNGRWEADLASLYLDSLARLLTESEDGIVTPIVDAELTDARSFEISASGDMPASWASEAWAWAEAEGLLTGNPRGMVDRQTLAVVLHRYHQEAEGK